MPKNNKVYSVILSVFVIIAVLAIGYALGKGGQGKSELPLLPGRLAIEEDYYNFGTVGLDNISHTYVIKNVGEGPLNIAKVSTSCGCTTARIKVNGAVSRSFGMDHGNLPRADIELLPGQEAEVIVTYNPLAHGLKNARGSFRRAVYIRTENPQGEYQLTFDVTVDPDKKPKKINGPSVQFDRWEHDFGQIPKKGGVVETTFQLTNSGDEPLQISRITTSCGCTSAEIEKMTIAPGETVPLVVKFDPDFHKEPQGRLERIVTLFTNMPDNEEVEVKIYAEIID